jgi:hypothetical protein
MHLLSPLFSSSIAFTINRTLDYRDLLYVLTDILGSRYLNVKCIAEHEDDLYK